MSGAPNADDACITEDHTAIALTEFRPRLEQLNPDGDWSTWLVLAGRGFGKTRNGAEWVNSAALAHDGVRIALVGATMGDVRGVMIEGEAGLCAVNPAIRYQPGLRRLSWPNGSVAMAYSAEEPGSLRGPAFQFGWADEVARFGDAGPEVLSNLRFALRKGECPRLLLTTTPLPLDWLMALADDPIVMTTRGASGDNHFHLPSAWLRAMAREYGGTARGRQELDGEFVTEQAGALWTREMLEMCRSGSWPELVRTVVAVDPPAGQGPGADACGIVVAGLDETAAPMSSPTAVSRASRPSAGPRWWRRRRTSSVPIWWSRRPTTAASWSAPCCAARISA